MQDEQSFRKALKRAGKKPHVIDGLVGQVADFEAFVAGGRSGGLAEATAQDIRDYAASLAAGEARKRVRGLALYFRHVGREELARAAAEIREQGIAKTRKVMRLRELRGVDPRDVARLKDVGIETTEQLLAAGRTKAERRQLSKHAGVSPDALLELVKLSDLARLWAVKAVRTRLYYDAGLDTPDKFVDWDPDALREMLIEFVSRSGFDGIAPLPKEIRFTIDKARQLPPAVEY